MASEVIHSNPEPVQFRFCLRRRVRSRRPRCLCRNRFHSGRMDLASDHDDVGKPVAGLCQFLQLLSRIDTFKICCQSSHSPSHAPVAWQQRIDCTLHGFAERSSVFRCARRLDLAAHVIDDIQMRAYRRYAGKLGHQPGSARRVSPLKQGPVWVFKSSCSKAEAIRSISGAVRPSLVAWAFFL
jgi:hypothetical protein